MHQGFSPPRCVSTSIVDWNAVVFLRVEVSFFPTTTIFSVSAQILMRSLTNEGGGARMTGLIVISSSDEAEEGGDEAENSEDEEDEEDEEGRWVVWTIRP